MRSGNLSILEGPSPRSDEAFQKLLLQFSAAAARGTGSDDLIQLFCHATRDFFQVDGAYFWQFASPDELVGTEAVGLMAEGFRGTRMKTTESAAAVDAIRRRKTVYVNRLDPDLYPKAAEFHALSIMAAPLVVSNEVIGAAVFLHASHPDFFSDDLAAKATILAGQLGSLLEAGRLTQVSREEHRRAEILVEVAHALHDVPDASGVVNAVADRTRALLRTPLVCILARQESGLQLQSVAASTPQLAASVRARHDRRTLKFIADLANRALAAEEPITVAIDPATHALGDLVSPGLLIVAPFRTPQTEGAVLVYPRQQGIFSADEKSMVAAIATFGAVAMANAELCAVARSQAHELHQLLEISADLGSVGQLDEFMQQFAVRAGDFLGFSRAFIGLLEEDGAFHARWGADHGHTILVNLIVPSGPCSDALLRREVFWSDDPSQVPGANLEVLSTFDVRQLLAVPLSGSDGQVLGMFGVLDRTDRAGISQEDIRRAQVLAGQAAVVLQVTRSLHLSEQHRQRAESLMELALEMNSLLQLPEFAKRFSSRAADIMRARAFALAVKQDSGLEILVLQGTSENDASLPRRFGRALSDVLRGDSNQIISSTALEMFGPVLATALGWSDCTLIRLLAPSGELVGVLCLADRASPLALQDSQLLQAIASHASVALENARLFTRMDQANRHWIEIFDAITDFIVVHDQSDNILRVNRSLADFIGVRPQQLIGVNMQDLLALGQEQASYYCPFCRGAGASPDEYVHPVLERTYLVSTSRVTGATSEGLQTIHVLKDITDRREAERRYRELFDNIQEGLFFSTEEGHFIEVNEAMVRMLGYESREELLQTDINSELYYSPEQRALASSLIKQHGVLRNYETTLRRKDGAAIHVLINAFAVQDSHGRVLQYRGLMLDITGLKSYQAELQRERDFSGKILNNTQSLILVVDTAGLISYANRRWSGMGYEQRQVLGTPLKDLVSESRRETFLSAFEATLAGRQADNLDLQILYGDGRVGQFSVNLSPMRDEQGTVTSVVVVMTDVTDSAILQSKLMHAEKLAAVGQLVSGVAHEVNNPLTAILGFADLLLENPELAEPVRKDLRVILQEAQRTKLIVQNLLSFARQMPPQRKQVQLNLILRRTVQLRAYDFHSHGVEVVEQLDAELPTVVGDSHQLQQVFLNILNNAYDAVRESGRPAKILISSQRRGDFVEVSFRDNGYGISYPDRIFDPFFTTKEVGKGTGLGLSICYGIVREHGGEILCHNNEGSEGATFVVRFPRTSEALLAGTSGGGAS
jgi:PAS domain S-box-containing protein